MKPVRLAIADAGRIGQAHLQVVLESPDCVRTSQPAHAAGSRPRRRTRPARVTTTKTAMSSAAPTAAWPFRRCGSRPAQGHRIGHGASHSRPTWSHWHAMLRQSTSWRISVHLRAVKRSHWSVPATDGPTRVSPKRLKRPRPAARQSRLPAEHIQPRTKQ